jgi:hypothetical protein
VQGRALRRVDLDPCHRRSEGLLASLCKRFAKVGESGIEQAICWDGGADLQALPPEGLVMSHFVTKRGFTEKQWRALAEVVQSTDALDEARSTQRQAIRSKVVLHLAVPPATMSTRNLNCAGAVKGHRVSGGVSRACGLALDGSTGTIRTIGGSRLQESV